MEKERTNNTYRTIAITGGTDATNSELIAWLEANATQVIESQPFSVVKFNNLTLGRINNHYLSTFNGVNVLSGISAGSSPVITDLSGTDWVLNEVLDFTGYADASEGTTSEWNVNFTSLYTTGQLGAELLVTLVVASDIDYLNMNIGENPGTLDTMTYYSINTQYEVYSNGREDNSARIITITGGTDVTNTNLISFLQSNAVQKDLIYFNVDLNPCAAENGMTWEEYISSIYNTRGIYLSGNYVSAGGSMIFYNGSVLKTDTIISGAAYTRGGGGSGN